MPPSIDSMVEFDQELNTTSSSPKCSHHPGGDVVAV
jgi:hypothetical protein